MRQPPHSDDRHSDAPYCTTTFKRRISMTTRKGRHIYKHTFPLVQHTKDDRHEDERARLPLRLPQPLTFPNVAVGGFAHATPNQLRKATQREWKNIYYILTNKYGCKPCNKLTLSYFRLWVSHKVATVPTSTPSVRKSKMNSLCARMTTAVVPACTTTQATIKICQHQVTLLHPQKLNLDL